MRILNEANGSFPTEAKKNLFETYEYIRAHDSKKTAIRNLNKLEKACLSLSTLSERGHLPKELLQLDMTGYFEIMSPPHRIIYKIGPRTVTIIGILDGRRDIPSILLSRLLRT